MARKRLIKGPNAERVEKRIADAPEDITETSIFKVLKEIEEKSKKTNKKQKTTEGNQSEKVSRKTKKRKKSEATPSHENLPETAIIQEKQATETEETRTSLRKAIKFTKAEREIIRKSCISYKNTLPIYLKAFQNEVKIIDNVLKKLKR